MIQEYWSLAEKFLKKGFWLYLFGYIIAPMWYITKIIISWEISINELGILYWTISLITLLSAFSDLWIWESLKYYIPKFLEKKQYDKIKSILCYGILIQVISWITLATMFFFGADFLATHYFKDLTAANVIKVFSLFFLWINIFQIFSNFLLAVQDTFSFKISEFIRTLSILLSIFWMIFIDINSVHMFSFAWIIWLWIWVISAAWLFYYKYYRSYLKNIPIIWSRKLSKQFFSYAIMVFLSAQAAVILSQIDMQMIIYLLSTTDAWYYSIYLSLIMIPFLIIWPIFVLLLPSFSELAAKEDFESIKRTKKHFTEIFLSVGLFFSVFLFFFWPIIAYILFGENFVKSGEIIKFSCLFLAFNFFMQINFNILGALAKLKIKLFITLIAIGINWVLNFILLQYIWVFGAALATWLWWFLIWWMSEYFLGKDFRTVPNYQILFKNISLLLILSVVLFFMNQLTAINSSRLWELLQLIPLMFLFLFLFISVNLKEFKSLKKLIFKR